MSDDYTRQLPSYTPHPPPRKKRHVLRWIGFTLTGLIALIVIISVAAGGNSSKLVVTPVTATPSIAAPAAPAPAAAAPSTPAMSVSRQQAVIAAQEYLDMGSGFSQAGLVQQLTSSAGDGFPKADAEFAVSYLKPDWNAQAVEAAKGYMSMGGFSRAGLIEQLTSSAGDGFTRAQAEYAANKVGL